MKRSPHSSPREHPGSSDFASREEATTLFGPVPSRRLGRSLGIDVIPPKTCSFDCVYCESGRTTCHTLERKVFVPPERIIQDLRNHLSDHPGQTDILTLSSAGEPTLYSALGDLLHMVKENFPELPLAVLTNGSLLWDPQVRKDLRWADIVIPSLDAVTSEVFRTINRPCRGLTVDAILEGLLAFRKEYRGHLRVEVLLVSHHNDHPAELARLARVLQAVQPDAVELNTVVRPPAFPGAGGLSQGAMEGSLAHFSGLNARIIGSYQGGGISRSEDRLDRRILALLERRPCAAMEMAQSLSVSPARMEQTLEGLLKTGSIVAYPHGGALYYCLPTRGHQRSRDG